MVSLDKTMWIPMLLIYSLPVSGALWAKTPVRGVVGKNITIDCHYGAWYRSHTKYWCHGWSHWCSVVVKTNGQHRRSGRWSITDNQTQGIFTVTVEGLLSSDTGWYSCGIDTSGLDPMFNVQLQVSDEPEPNPGSSTTTVALTSTTKVTSENNDHAPSSSDRYNFHLLKF
ncbi:CMRF35-like molecule 1 [Leucoraja erinacea]|uniref:CMRF35-like molecule 1 n=1 Tax=Leucoraja erinaceus TaxID=7782 RepID=UPI002454B063|nr:CMRF35-like molecule 1 [Leucoraja erinacea]